MKALLKRIWEWIKALFQRPTPEQPEGPIKTALLFGINDYPGSVNDLSFCLNDIEDVAKNLKRRWPEFIVKEYADDRVTVSNFLRQLRKHIEALRPDDVLLVYYSGHGTQVYDRNGDESDGYDEALFLHDGPLVDDDIGDVLRVVPEGAKVVLMFDSCFSGTVTKAVGQRIRFHEMEGLRPRYNVRKSISKSSKDLGYVVFSGCSENEYSVEAIIGGRGNGAFTYYTWDVALSLGPTTFQAWFDAIALPNDHFKQNPTLEGWPDLINSTIF